MVLLETQEVTYVREKWGRFKGELLRLSSLETLAEPGRVHGHNEQNHENRTM